MMVTVRSLFFLLSVVFHSSFRCEGYTLMQETFGEEGCLEDDWVTHHDVGAVWFNNTSCERLQCVERGDMRYIQIYGCPPPPQDIPKDCWLDRWVGDYPDCCLLERCQKRRYPKACRDKRGITRQLGSVWYDPDTCEKFECKEDARRYYVETTKCSELQPLNNTDYCWIHDPGYGRYPDCCPFIKCRKGQKNAKDCLDDDLVSHPVGAIWYDNDRCEQMQCIELGVTSYIQKDGCQRDIKPPNGCTLGRGVGNFPHCCPYVDCSRRLSPRAAVE